jgi:hypothetical protein
LDVLRELPDFTKGEFQYGLDTRVPFGLKVRPEVPLIAGFTHVRLAQFFTMLRFTWFLLLTYSGHSAIEREKE